MRQKFTQALLICGLLGNWIFLEAQPLSIHLEPLAGFGYTRFFSNYATVFDRLDRPYMYAAAKELGLLVFDLRHPDAPVPIDTLRGAPMHQLDVTNLFQQGTRLYAALGGIQGIPQKAGLAVLDVQNPEQPQVLGVWESPDFKQGCAIVQVDGQYAYLGAMEEGLLILDVADPGNIQLLSRFKPDPAWPGAVVTPPNARGLAIRNQFAYLCYDAGGLRIIDVSDKVHPFEVGRYVNTALTAQAAPAYNNVRLSWPYAFVAVDYCGLEVIDVGQAATPKNVAWLNPWSCKSTSWFGSKGHLNELVLSADQVFLFASGGDSELLVFDVRNPAQPQIATTYAMPGDSSATWGVDVWHDRLALSYINNSSFPLFQPFYADFGGIQWWQWQRSTAVQQADQSGAGVQTYPNPIQARFLLVLPAPLAGDILRIWDLYGNPVLDRAIYGNTVEVAAADWPPGVYWYRVGNWSGKLLKY